MNTHAHSTDLQTSFQSFTSKESSHVALVLWSSISVQLLCSTFYINSLIVSLSFLPFSLASRPSSVIFYAHHAVLLSYACIILKCMLSALAQYCNNEHHCTKPKIIVFNRRSGGWLMGLLLSLWCALNIRSSFLGSWHTHIKTVMGNRDGHEPGECSLVRGSWHAWVSRTVTNL